MVFTCEVKAESRKVKTLVQSAVASLRMGIAVLVLGCSATAEEGRGLFIKHGCYSCHGYEGQGALLTGPRLAPEPIPMESFASIVRSPYNVMPAYSPEVLSRRDLQSIYRFLLSIPRPDEQSVGEDDTK